MSHVKTSLLASMVVFGLVTVANSQDWKPFESSKGKFKAEFPSKPNEQTLQINTAVGKVPYHAFIAQTGGGKVAWGVSYNDYPNVIARDDVDKVLQGGKKGAMGRFNAKIINEIKLEIDGHRGLEFTLQGKTNGKDLIYHSRIFMVGSRMYQLQIIQVDGEPVDLPDVFKFLGSFQLTSGKGGGVSAGGSIGN